MYKENIGKRIKLAREKAGYSQPDLAERCGWGRSQSRIGNYEQGKREATVDELAAIATALQVEPAWLILGVGRQAAPVSANQEIAEYQIDPEVAEIAALWGYLPQFKRQTYKQLIEHDAALSHVLPWYVKLATPKNDHYIGWEKTIKTSFNEHVRQMKLAF